MIEKMWYYNNSLTNYSMTKTHTKSLWMHRYLESFIPSSFCLLSVQLGDDTCGLPSFFQAVLCAQDRHTFLPSWPPFLANFLYFSFIWRTLLVDSEGNRINPSDFGIQPLKSLATSFIVSSSFFNSSTLSLLYANDSSNFAAQLTFLCRRTTWLPLTCNNFFVISKLEKIHVNYSSKYNYNNHS